MALDQQILDRARRSATAQKQTGVGLGIVGLRTSVAGSADEEGALSTHLCLQHQLTQQNGQRPALVALVSLGQVAGKACRPVAEDLDRVTDRSGHASRSLEHDERGLVGRDLREGGPARRRGAGQESDESERVWRQPGRGQRRCHRRGSGNADDRDAGLDRSAHQAVAGVADQRGASVADERDVLAGAEPRQQLIGAGAFVVVVVADRARPDVVVAGERGEVPRVLGGDDAHASEHVARARAQVIGIADRHGDEVERPSGGHGANRSIGTRRHPSVTRSGSISRVPGLIECVPNFSEGRRADVVDEIVGAIGQIDGVTVLDHSRDETHNRSVVTFAGSAEPVVRAATAGVGRALELIDMEQHVGAHPRIGAVDVIPFVPLGTTRIEECVDLARRFGEQIAGRFELPVYLYGEAALRPARRRLADVRRGQYEAIRDEIATNPERAPDFGPARIHPRGGAVAVGARRPLIAFNINLRTDQLAVAIKIANAIRESSGGMPAVQAMGVLLENPGQPPMAQVSTNLVDWQRTGIPDVVREVRRLAREAGTDVDHCELIGLAPTGALLEVTADALGLVDFSVDQALELRLARDR